MKLENDFTVPASIDEAWAFLLDVPRVAPCLPGATVEPETDEDGTYKGSMKIKIGPITAQYKGTVRIQEADEANHTVAMRAQAKDARGQGSASATITSTMEETAEGTKVSVVDRHARHRPGRPVRPRRDAGRLREADEALRRLHRRGAERVSRSGGGGTGRGAPRRPPSRRRPHRARSPRARRARPAASRPRSRRPRRPARPRGTSTCSTSARRAAAPCSSARPVVAAARRC